ncbi:MAG: hypothetical protein BRC29_00190 [Nanohaloarchaea archaeon SW_7_43_1]|nr:MAG: hypothetical protein BRC29_00190 [Nanohaloarchaea archaeon SW_7_43_1]
MNERIEIDPEVMTGKPVIRGTRIPVHKIVELLSQGMTAEDLLEEYPAIEKEDVNAALDYAAETLEEESVFKTGGDDLEIHS